VPAVQRKYRRKRENEGKAPERELDATEVAAREKMLLMRGKGLTSLYQQKVNLSELIMQVVSVGGGRG